MKTKTLPQRPSAPERVYVAASAVAQAIGFSVVDLDNNFRPSDWGAPRDFTFRRELLYARDSLPSLADWLARCGQREASRLLTEYHASLERAEPAYRGPEEPGRLVPVERLSADQEQLDRLAAGKRHASDRETLPRNWANDWEGQHE